MRRGTGAEKGGGQGRSERSERSTFSLDGRPRAGTSRKMTQAKATEAEGNPFLDGGPCPKTFSDFSPILGICTKEKPR